METDFAVDFVDFADGFVSDLAGDFAIGLTGLEIGRIGFGGGVFVGGGLVGGFTGFAGVDLAGFGDFFEAVGVTAAALCAATPVLQPWLCSSDWNLIEPLSTFVRHFAGQL